MYPSHFRKHSPEKTGFRTVSVDIYRLYFGGLDITELSFRTVSVDIYQKDVSKDKYMQAVFVQYLLIFISTY